MKRTLLLLVLLAACPKPKEDLGTPGVSAKPNDQCTILPHHCPGRDEDGCPDVIIEVGDACALNADGVRHLNAAADELLNHKELTRVTIEAPSLTCANIARAHLEQRGVPGWRVLVAAAENRTFINFTVEAIDEKRCADGAPAKPPGGSVY